MVDNFVHLRF